VDCTYDGVDFLKESVFIADWESWHQDDERRRASPHGFLAITGMHWLDDSPQRFDDVPGAWSSHIDNVRVDLNVDEALSVDDTLVTNHYDFENVDERGEVASFGDAIVEVCRRGDSLMIRPRHPDHPARNSYVGTPTFPVSGSWVIDGTFDPNDKPRSVDVGASVEGLNQKYVSSGSIEFELDDEVHRLIAFDVEDTDELFIVFADATSGDTSYAPCRFLDAHTPRSDGQVTLDFNRATNPPCAYTDFATCPLLPAGNHLPVRIEAGERAPSHSH
jgi:uncharacterized protein (DUF1684 family)